MSIDLGIVEKIRKLKTLYTGENVSPEATLQIEAWEKRLRELSDIDDFSNLNTTKELVSILKERLKKVLLDRALTKGKSSDFYLVMDAHEEELRFFLDKLMPPYSSEMTQIETLIDAELTP